MRVSWPLDRDLAVLGETGPRPAALGRRGPFPAAARGSARRSSSDSLLRDSFGLGFGSGVISAAWLIHLCIYAGFSGLGQSLPRWGGAARGGGTPAGGVPAAGTGYRP